MDPGTCLGNYEVVAQLGAGGMGEVYRARDNRLNRFVAIKVLLPNLAADVDRVRRFEAEARAASALNHPHIISIFETGRTETTSYIAMELVDGLPLDAWKEGQRPGLERILEVIAQVADALSVAHDAGIVHRDLKPANLLVTPQGYVKVVDFGLAKMIESPAGDAETQVAEGLTDVGAVIGTAAYMSPEQALGRPVDRRTDVFSLGAIVYEMAAGRRPFEADSTLDLLHAVVHQATPRLRDIAPGCPQQLDWVVEKALAKDANERYQTMRELAVDIKRVRRLLQRGEADTATTPVVADRRRRVNPIVWCALAVTLVGAAWMLGRASARLTEAPSAAFAPTVALTQLTSDVGYEGEATFSADGRTIAFVSDRTGDYEVFLRQVSGGPSINLTNNAADDVQPAFSPDGRQIAFVSSRAGTSDILFGQPNVPLLGGDIWVMAALGGGARRIAEKGNFPSWSRDGSAILYTGGPWFGQKLHRVSAAGGVPTEIPLQFPAGRALPGQLTYPHYSPDGRWILFVGVPADVYVVKADGGVPTHIARGRMAVWSADSRWIVYSSAEPGRNESLWRVGFDADAGRALEPAHALTIDRGADLQPAMSPDGKLIAFTAVEVSSNVERMPFDAETGRQTGAPQPVTFGKDSIYFFTASPDGGAVSFGLMRGLARSLWRADADGTLTPLTSELQFGDSGPRWSPQGTSIAFNRGSSSAAAAGEPESIWMIDADGSNPRRLIERAGLTGLFAWTPDARSIVSVSLEDRQLYVLDLATKVQRRLTNESGVMPIIVTSRDGRWVIYQSVEKGDVDLRAVPLEGGASRPVVDTAHKDYHPTLSPSGRWLYYLHDHKAIYSVPGPAQDWRRTPPEPVIDFRLRAGEFVEDPQVSQDGRYLLYARGRFAGDIWVASIER